RPDLIATEEAGDGADARRAELIGAYGTALLNPYEAAGSGYIDAVIAPSETRAQTVRALRGTAAKRHSRTAKKHGNIPLRPRNLNPPALQPTAHTCPKKKPPPYWQSLTHNGSTLPRHSRLLMMRLNVGSPRPGLTWNPGSPCRKATKLGCSAVISSGLGE